MPRLLLSFVVIAAVFGLLCGPTLWVALRAWRRGDLGAMRPLRAVWLGQVVLAAACIFMVDEAGFTNPLGWMLATVLAVGLLGAAAFAAWRLMVRKTGR